ncbi:MAG: bifunctional prephenate dehydrogenase/3-phosphoshikimate 1-carboxyvinyltransferase [Porticoccaceae bacterium]|nr:bifunctional prephenate dehydrogenase/3-phosphoshikimate 1-carboxyvinyltransferase [Porticoccaceae bacterium]MDG1474751.1 bifunctional prephenate dehydrogenase/3-phosphoshikimate 1-carboxyvinyltransferase [Porticoccaceae bacterium]
MPILATDKPRINRLVIIGLGLIGSSLASAAKSIGLVNTVIGISRRSSTLELAMDLSIVDEAYQDLASVAPQLTSGDVVVIGVPTLSVPVVMADCHRLLSKDVTITDVASVKGSVVDALRDVYGELPEQFVPGHPIAGSEKSGVTAADKHLFRNHRVILTPHGSADTEHFFLVSKLWSGVGGIVTTMNVQDHDVILAATSHLPHFLAYSLVDTLASMGDNREIFRYAAGGFRDFTRIAASDPVMWRDIALANQQSILHVLDEVMGSFQMLRKAIDESDADYLMDVFTRARDARNHFGKLLETNTMQGSMTDKIINYRVTPGGHGRGILRVPGDKSMSHRSIILSSIAEGMTEITGFLEGEDSLATLRAFREMGVVIEGPDQGRVVVHGVGLKGLKAPAKPLNMGNSGTSIRLLSGLLAGQSFDTELIGDISLTGRPMGRVADPLRAMGARIETSQNGTPPLKITGGQTLQAIHYDMPMASAQVKSCVLLAGLYAKGVTAVTEPAPTRDHTERMLQGFGYTVSAADSVASLTGGGALQGTRIDVPADISSAAFFMVGAAITPGSDITLRHVGINPTRIGVINILRQMGTAIHLTNAVEVGGEPVADIRIQYAPLQGIEIPKDQVPLAIDEFPVLFIAAACAEGITRLTGAEELRVKESDRIQSMADGLVTLGIDATPTADGIVIVGGTLGQGHVSSHHDHRIAMAFAIAGLRAHGEITIEECNNVATSFPDFIETARAIGLVIGVEPRDD